MKLSTDFDIKQKNTKNITFEYNYLMLRTPPSCKINSRVSLCYGTLSQHMYGPENRKECVLQGNDHVKQIVLALNDEAPLQSQLKINKLFCIRQRNFVIYPDDLEFRVPIKTNFQWSWCTSAVVFNQFSSRASFQEFLWSGLPYFKSGIKTTRPWQTIVTYLLFSITNLQNIFWLGLQ